MADTRLFPFTAEKVLKADLLSSDSSFKIRDIVWYTTSDGTDTNLSSSDFGTVAYGVFEPRTDRQEFFTWDPSTIASATSTGATINLRGLKPGANYSTEVSGLKFNHPSGSKVILMTNAPGFYNDFVNKANDETITGTHTFSTTPVISNAPVSGTDAANKTYVDGVAVAGAPNASTTVKGIIEIATNAEMGSATSTGATGAVLVPANDQLVKTSSGAGDENKIPVLNASGELAAGFIDNASTTARGQVEIATAAETVAGTATGGTGAVLAPDNANFKAVASTTISNDTSKVPVTSATTGVFDSLFFCGTGTSGEAVTIGDALYIKASDSKLYKADSDADESTFSFVGIAQTTVAAADLTVRFARPGQIATGLSGLTAGSYYYITGTAGTIGTTPGTRIAKVGQAMSTTTLRVIEPEYVKMGQVTLAAADTAENTVTVGFRPKQIHIRATVEVTGGQISGISVGDDSNTCVRMIPAGSTTGVEAFLATRAWSVYRSDNAAVRNEGTVTSKSATGFGVTASTAALRAELFYVATG